MPVIRPVSRRCPDFFWEQNEAAVERFVRKMGDKMTYRVALDDKTEHKEGAMAETWMKAAGQDGIPAAFLVGEDGKIAWIGHPMSLKEKTVELVLSGQFALAKAIADAKKEKENEAAVARLQERFGEAMETNPPGEGSGPTTCRPGPLTRRGGFTSRPGGR